MELPQTELWGLLHSNTSNPAKSRHPIQLCVEGPVSVWSTGNGHSRTPRPLRAETQKTGVSVRSQQGGYFFFLLSEKDSLLAVIDYLFLKVSRALKRIAIPKLPKIRVINNDQYLFILQIVEALSSDETGCVQGGTAADEALSLSTPTFWSK